MIRSVTFFLLMLGQYAHAQRQPTLPGKLPGSSVVNHLRSQKGGTVFSLGGGISQPQGNYAKDSTFIGNGWQLQGDVFIPLLKSIGINGAVNYAQQQGKQSLSFVQQQYQLTNGMIAPSVSGSNALQTFSVTAGPQLQWKLGGLTIAPGVNAGYMSLSRNGFTVSDSLSEVNAPVRKRNIDFVSTDAVKASGLAVIPRLKLGYALTEQLSLWAGIQYTLGPSVSTTSRFWQPLGEAKEGKYSYAQYAEGRSVTSTSENAYEALNMQAGLSFTMPRKKAAAVKEAMMPATITQAAQPEKQQDTTGQRQRASAPVILTPDHHIAASLHKGNLHFNYIPSDYPQSKMKLVIWKIKAGRREKVFEQQYPAGWNGVVAGNRLQIDSSAATTYEAQLTASYQPGAKGIGSNRAQFAAGGIPVYENNGNSNVAAFNMQSNCTVDHSFMLDSTRCISGDTIRIWGHAQILPNSAGVSTGTLTFDPSFLEITGNTTVTPVNMQPGNAITVNLSSPVTFSFDVTGEMCNKKLRVFYDFSYQCPSLNVPAHIPCADTISLPCCICSYCDDPRNMNIVQGAQSMSQTAGGLLQIQQQFTVSPKNITKVTAQIVYISDSVTDAACRSCTENEPVVYHFSGVNQAQWNGGGAIAANANNSSHLFPSKLISWASNNQGHLSLNMQLGLPALAALECCSRQVRICIRYSFTDRDCKVCERLVCYEWKQQAATHSSPIK